ncbi:urea ABC transporter ATP-binding protein UrtD [Synoicihabitans lomoniglobus]|uniref:Urea ABC transporter ATP-binding protein UrtD n=1 Tax=Synoicihabitans lomoniglobus TaxID=2909285 RepID=A0AAF0A1C1_9BACT|nr:urea ABC transporter ATP-binding protein UrtD [Opitutaceae bacterium LMO-M01]WED64897.1 urea ABC transporter ATP-binding protein UrtD [Opitutaceae bacterium LMO-M01]
MSHPILNVEDVSKSYDGFKAISGLNFYLFKGELRTVIGPNGAGKSTFFDLITGRAKPDVGKIEFGDHDLTQLNEFQINRLGIGRKFQTPSVYSNHTVWENLLLSLSGTRGVFASLFFKLSSDQSDRIDELLKLIRLDDKRDWKAGALAHGEKQWLEIGMLLASDPEVLLIDEPAAGMTDEETHRTGELLLSLAGQHSLVVVEHDMTFVKQIAQDTAVTVLHQGSVLFEGKFDEVQANQKVREVYLGRGKHEP